MPAVGPASKDGHEVATRANDSRLRWYPRSWRARYGDEFAALLDEEYGRSLPARSRLSLVTGGLRQRARASGLAGDAAPPAEGVRAGALVVLVAWAAFVVAGASFAKFSEHFDEALPHDLGTHHLPDFAFTVLQAIAGVASTLVAVGALLAFPALMRFMRSGGWVSVRGHFLRAVGCSALTIAVTVPLLVRANHLSSKPPDAGIHWDGLLFLAWAALVVLTLTSWTVVAVAAGRRIELSKAVLTMEAVLAGFVALAMVIMVVAVAVWWGAMAIHAPAFLNASPAGLPGSSWDILLIVTVALMSVAMCIAVIGVVREVRLWTTMRAG
jgi:hypothetical protein